MCIWIKKAGFRTIISFFFRILALSFAYSVFELLLVLFMNTITRTLKRVRSIVLLFIVMFTTPSLKATDFIKDVMAIGGTKGWTNMLGDVYGQVDWKVIDYDLNKGVEGDYVYLLYQTSSNESNINDNYIRDFYLYRVASQNTPYSFKDGYGRTWYLAMFDGADHFRGQLGDFNSGTGESTDPIHLYYTRDPLPNDDRAVTKIWFNDDPSGAVGKNGGSEAYNLNEGCGKKTTKIYMHIQKERVNPSRIPSVVQVDKISGGDGQINIKGAVYDPDVPSVTIDLKVSIYKVGSYFSEPYKEVTITPQLTDKSFNSEKKLEGPHNFDTHIPCIEEGDYNVILQPIDHNGDNSSEYKTDAPVHVKYKPVLILDDYESEKQNNYIGQKVDVMLKGHSLLWDGQYHTICLPFDVDDFKDTPFEFATIVTLYGSTFEYDTLSIYLGPKQTSIKAGVPYLISYTKTIYDLIIRTVEDWNAFAASVANGNTYEGKTVVMANDIGRGYEPVKTMVGTEEHPFRGTFDGNHNVLYVNIDGYESGAAPFHCIEGATIRSLNVQGAVRGADMTAGLVGYAQGDNNRIEQCDACLLLYTIKSFTGGLVGCCKKGATVTIEDSFGACAALLGVNHYTGLMCGYCYEGGTVNINNCYAEGSILHWDTADNIKIDLLYGNGNININNTYKRWDYGKYGQYMIFDNNRELIKALLGDNFTVNSNGDPTLHIHSIHNLKKVFDVMPDPVFENVTIKETSYTDPETWVISNYTAFIGSTIPLNLSKISYYYVGEDGISNRGILSNCRAFFIPRNIPAGSSVIGLRIIPGKYELYDEIVKAPVLPVKEDTVPVKVDGWYTIDGRKLESAPTTKGLYIYNGRSVMIR